MIFVIIMMIQQNVRLWTYERPFAGLLIFIKQEAKNNQSGFFQRNKLFTILYVQTRVIYAKFLLYGDQTFSTVSIYIHVLLRSARFFTKNRDILATIQFSFVLRILKISKFANKSCKYFCDNNQLPMLSNPQLVCNPLLEKTLF